ncbi:MAG TPA: PT domain-containing protein [Nocardioides sp.]|uniref:PT domain-containing protein n=1 Tax=Nocardioides sp. TaxID=35761 RepID=UPI002E365F56|nr:PT domain-containing protein [Nocardioides sp.]HEX5089222.1 PT domain-containing protein [Nocardioides sp.]
MTDGADRFLEERLHSLARGVPVPVVPPGEDVRRGRRRLLRMRLAMAGATTGTLAVVLGITGLTAGDPKATEVPPSTQVPTVLPATPSATPSDKGQEATPGSHDRGGGDDPVGGAAGPGTDRGADAGAPPSLDQVKNAPTAEVSAGTAQHHGVPWVEPTSAPTSTPSGLPSGDPTGDPTGLPSGTPTDLVTPTPTDPTTVPPPTEPPPTGDTKVRIDRVLAYYNDVLAEHLDPDRAGLQPYDRRIDPKATRRSDGQLFALGATYRWERGRALSGLEIMVASGWDQVDWDCGATYSDWSCHVVDSGTVRAEVAIHDGVRRVAVEHADGQVVVVTADPTYDGSHRLATSDGFGGSGGSEAALVAAASDARLILPGRAPQAPPTIASDAFASAGRAALLSRGETFTQTSLDRSPAVRGTWSGAAGAGGTLRWSARPVYSGGGFSCLVTYLRCTTVAVGDGTTVDVALLRTKAGGGWLVQYDGPSYAVRVYSSDRTFPRKPAYAFVTRADWQPARDATP